MSRLLTLGRTRHLLPGLLAIPLVITSTPVASAAEEVPVWGMSTSLVTTSPTGRPANGPSYDSPVVSRHGRYVAFTSEASNLVPRDGNAVPDVFVRDRLVGTTVRVSVGRRGQEANGQSITPSISADGRYVVFTSEATNLVRRDNNDAPDVFLRDLVDRTTQLVSKSTTGEQGAGINYDGVISADGNHIVFVSDAANLVARDTNAAVDVFVRDRLSRVTQRVSVGRNGQGDDRSFGRAISRDGRYVAFASGSTNLVRGDTNDRFDVFLRDRVVGKTVRVSVGPRGRQAVGGSPFDAGFPQAVSPNGRFVLFDEHATNLVRNDTNERFDVFVRDRAAGTTRRVSVDSDGDQLSQDSFAKGMTAGSRIILFASNSALTPGDTNTGSDLFLRDRIAGTTSLVSVAASGLTGNESSQAASLSVDGRHVAFLSHANDLVRRDRNPDSDIFVRDTAADAKVRTPQS